MFMCKKITNFENIGLSKASVLAQELILNKFWLID